ncbi:MarR family transcriptional regulator [Cytophagaceae bacterium DM2B3-1]|uniref:MarR family transcriptional regulator n=2 Tax=Xanthocytophaga TaxID=3078918 RepID=A0ABT7CZ85_9BACT|nr:MULTISPECIES: MarR family transcriptional regulator [Xanthocytophaga]MDJ1470696.1 MarR family transcriptional regulator [Xanthocytophaga flavus]MDJ1498275.1 MarR family transcriptional regulator [Xanthocytophaga flavus]MDJ1505280.1 MarR family transcriptional regulator [Xanthocytophaga agilis]
MVLTEKQKELIERFGVLNEKYGLPPAECRVWGLFLVADKVELTFEEIMETLHLSKGGTSTALNRLMMTNHVEYITKLGDKKRYFRCKMNNWTSMTKDNFEKFDELNSILKEILEVRDPKTQTFNHDLKQVTEFLDFIYKELMIAIKKWEDKK